ncbi:hypothetical protein CDL12_15929 [Handroanthus impetiginosus]|uniref:C2H2-type domain-containing protein n=1 Tax=Handroanthus impetiginosus TaxID=429701 RepID=A0A2G9H1U2_9LAMI|nr:hypothetical protein CDL12_22316 [Handroanthus impetiginosus]PIN11461.1 hypothetical protein CDL12_15929 [Handroanthus impetiginosus]
MASHSERDKGLKDDHSWTSIDSHSDTEAEETSFRTRSSRNKRYKKIVENCCSFPNNGSSCVSEIDGQEQEEVAMCLLLLSKDSGNSVVESSDNTSVVLETKSSSIEIGIGKKESVNNIHNQDEIPQVKIGLKDSTAFDDDIAQMENSDSGYFLDECAKAESDVSVDGLRRYGAFEVRKRKYNSENLESERMMKNGDSICNTSQKKSYECLNCKKTFKSYQALGGHRPCHKRSNVCYESRCESSGNNLDDATDYRKSSAKNSSRSAEKKVKSKKNKGHICPFCNKVFKNGQALGGHKRSHFIGGHERNDNQSPVVKTEVPDPELRNQEAPDIFDLNLLPPEANEDDQGQFFSW